jgi:hypothetical protein
VITREELIADTFVELAGPLVAEFGMHRLASPCRRWRPK